MACEQQRTSTPILYNPRTLHLPTRSGTEEFHYIINLIWDFVPMPVTFVKNFH